MKKRRDAREKAKIALEAIRGELTSAQISAKYKVTSGQISLWKKQLLTGAANIFSCHPEKRDKSQELLIDELYKQIGQLTIERDWLKKKYDLFGSG